MDSDWFLKQDNLYSNKIYFVFWGLRRIMRRIGRIMRRIGRIMIRIGRIMRRIGRIMRRIGRIINYCKKFPFVNKSYFNINY